MNLGFVGTFFFNLSLQLSWMSEQDCLNTCCFGCLICMCFVFLYSTCSQQLSMSHMERRSRNMFIIIIIITIKHPQLENITEHTIKL